ncbi:MAG: tripartite tricarboxylate transporter permease [Clostridia bacterium]
MNTAVIEGIISVLSDPMILLLIFAGVGIGIIFGSLPGLTATMAITMCLPLTYVMTPIAGMSVLVALYIGGISGGLIAAILLNIPGTPSSVATCFDGSPMAEKGESGKALGAGIVFSFLGTIFGLTMLLIISPVLAKIAIKFGPFEYCALAMFSLSLVITLTGKDLPKGLTSALIGVMLATVGLAPIDAAKRFTFGNVQLNGGFSLLVLLIGLYAMTEVLATAEKTLESDDYTVKTDVRIKGFGFSLKEFFSQLYNSLRSAFIGLGVGILPGIGGGISCMLAYTVAKNQSKYPEKFGTGIIDGIVASETANNATIGGAMIPLLTLGIPGDSATAMLLGGLMIHNVAPGPLIFQKSGSVVYGIYTAMLLASVAMLILEFWGMRIFMRILKIPKSYLLPVVIVLCIVGAFGANNRMFDVWTVLVFGILGYGFIKAKFPLPPMILGFILGPIFELNFRRVVQHAQISPYAVFQQPIAIVFFIITILVIVFSLRSTKRENMKSV